MSASALENRRESGACSKVANGPTAAELLELVDAAIVALDADETSIARAQLQALAEAVRAQVTAAARWRLKLGDGEERTG